MDLMGIDQVLVIPTMVIMHLPFARNDEGLDVFCQAYNDFLVDWCAEVPDRLFGAALLPVQDPMRTAKEIYRAHDLGHPVGSHPTHRRRGQVPERAPSRHDGGRRRLRRGVPRLRGDRHGARHAHVPGPGHCPHPLGPDYLCSPGDLFTMAGTDSQTFSFIHEMQVWLAQVLLSGFLDRYRSLKMAVFESNAEWLPYTLDTCDRLFKLYANERGTQGRPAAVGGVQRAGVISFESDEDGVFVQWDEFEDMGIWASDAYHHDGADVVERHAPHGPRPACPRRCSRSCWAPTPRRWYGIEPKLFVTDEAGPIERPDWFPQGPELDEWADKVAHPREHMDELKALGHDPESLLNARMAAVMAQRGAAAQGASY